MLQPPPTPLQNSVSHKNLWISVTDACLHSFWIVAFIADAATINPLVTKILLANGSSTTILIKEKLVFSNGPKNLPRNPPHCPILNNYVFENFKLADELLAKALRSIETCVSVNNKLCVTLASSSGSPNTFERFKVTSVPCFIPDFNSLSCELDNFTFKVLY